MARFSQNDSQLVTELIALSGKAPKLVKSSVYSAPADPHVSIRSWKMNEFKYYEVPSPFPTLARGLFTLELPDAPPPANARHRIVVRGYDKFFNIGELPMTTWTSLDAHTCGPYVLSLKSNGCIIFIAALDATKLLITSKHSLGPVAGSLMSHAQAGEMWLRKYLEKVGRSESDLAARLYENNWTAVAELCDDAFEEHVIGYPPETTGLHLHGINVSTKAFHTLPTSVVDEFADEWGFIKTLTTSVGSIDQVRKFTEKVSNDGEWNGVAVEGFVVRTHITHPPSTYPYPHGSCFFFKVKFDEPYMMYRDWREVTKMLLNAKTMSPSILPKTKMKRPETKVYVDWVIDEINRDHEKFALYTKGKGIIATRERFLAWLATEEGQKALDNKRRGEDTKKSSVTPVEMSGEKTVIVPIAIPGCGKTSVAIALCHIFGFAHTQSDDIGIKKSAPLFIKNVKNLVNSHNVVIADKNNHLRQHRHALRTAFANSSPPVRLLALHWALDMPPAFAHRICQERIMTRGDNHQSLRADTAHRSHEDVLWMFLGQYNALTDDEVDATIEMVLDEPFEAAVQRAVDGVVRILKLERPRKEKILEAVRIVQQYTPKTKKKDPAPKKVSSASPRYFALLPEVDLGALIHERLGEGGGTIPTDLRDLWQDMKKNDRVARRPHVTIQHKNALPKEESLWAQCQALQGMPVPLVFSVKLTHLVWDERVLAIMCEEITACGVEDEQMEMGNTFLGEVSPERRSGLHITVGTKDASIMGVEAKTLVDRWRKGDRDGVQTIALDGRVVYGLIKPMMG